MDVKSILGQINLKTYLWEITSKNTNVIHWLTTPALIFVYGGLFFVFVFFYNINDLSNKNKETQDGFKLIWLNYFVRNVFHLPPNIGRFRFCKNKRIETGYIMFSLEWARREKCSSCWSSNESCDFSCTAGHFMRDFTCDRRTWNSSFFKDPYLHFMTFQAWKLPC